MSQDLALFKAYLKDKSFPAKEKTKLLKQYAKSLGMSGAGKKSGKKLVEHIVQGGGSWSSFTNWVKGAVNTVGNTAKKVGNAVADASKTVYNKALKPGAEYVYNEVKNKPLTSIGKAASALSTVAPGPYGKALGAVGAVSGAIGNATGMGMSGGAYRNAYGKPTLAFSR